MRIEEICKKYDITNYNINEDGSVDVDGSVDLDYCKLTKLPLKFGVVTLDFYCRNNQLTTLEGSPESVGGNFNCNGNNLTDLKGSPKSIGGGFYCSNNPIESIFNNVDMDFIRAFNTFKVLKDRVIDLKRLKYVMELFDLPINIGRIKRNFRIK